MHIRQFIIKAARMVRNMTMANPDENALRPEIPQAVIRPLSDHEREALLQGNNTILVEGHQGCPRPLAEYLRPHGLLIWQTREAFVELFSSLPGFDADYFRKCCLPVDHQLPADICQFCFRNRNHQSARIHAGCCERNQLGA